MKLRKVLSIASLALLASCGGEQKASQVAAVQEYKMMDIAPRELTIKTSYTASIKGQRDIKIIPRVGGYLTGVRASEGKVVKKGDVLFTIDKVPYVAEYDAAVAAIAVAKASVATSQLSYDSKKNLFDKNIVSSYDLKSAENNLITANANLKVAEAKATLAKNNLSYTTITSPADGVVGKLPYRVGDYVSTAVPDGLTVVADNSNMYVYFSMTERSVMDLMTGYSDMASAINALPAVELELSNGTIYQHKGKIEAISGIVDSSTGSVSFRAVFANAEGKLLSGGVGSVIMPTYYNDVFVIPQGATFEIQDKTYVYKDVNGVATAAIVGVEKLDNGIEYVVNSGLKAGDVIIAEGAGLVQKGTKIKRAK